MKRLLFVAFALVAYAIFLLTLAYLIAFLGDLPGVPRTIDRPDSGLPLAAGILIDLALIALFGVQHTIMARKSFKAVWTKVMPKPIERSGYMIFTCLALLALFAFWQPLPGHLWDASGTLVSPLLWAVFVLGWLVALVSTFLINHFELFGLAQVWEQFRTSPLPTPGLRQPFLYRFVRHPLYAGFLIAFWATPTMTYGHLLFAVAMTGYILIAIEFEERDLISHFGAQYEAYRGTVGKLMPRLR